MAKEVLESGPAGKTALEVSGLSAISQMTGKRTTIKEARVAFKEKKKQEAELKVAKARAFTAKLDKVWMATYKAGLEEHGNQEKAIADADSAVAKLRKQSGKQTPSTKEKPSLDSFFK